MQPRAGLSGALALALLALLLAGRSASAAGLLSPEREIQSMRIAPGLRLELVAAEPDVASPVAIAFDADGRMFVAEMRDYPFGNLPGREPLGRIRMLESTRRDGHFDRSTIYAERIPIPTGVMAYRGGVLVCSAPDILFLQDTRRDGRADVRRTLFSGFGKQNIQALFNGLHWGLDNWIYAAGGGNGGTIRSLEHPERPALNLGRADFRIHPDAGVVEATTGGSQYGLALDDWGNRFVCSNQDHLRHVVLGSSEDLARNPYFAVSETTAAIPDHGAAAKLFPLSPPESWRLARTSRRASAPDAGRYASTELFPNGYITSACGLTVYRGTLLPEPFRGNVFVCDPANNLIHRDVLTPSGATFVARRGEPQAEFLASRSNWFRPVFLTVGPDGALYVADFSRGVIEHPESIPDDIKRSLDLEQGRDRGRIYRIVPAGLSSGAPAWPQLSTADSRELAARLSDPNAWRRETAQRLLVERQDPHVLDPLRVMARSTGPVLGRLHALWTLQGMNASDPAALQRTLGDREPRMRVQALRLVEKLPAISFELRARVLAAADDSDPRVRFQAALTLGRVAAAQAGPALARIARRGTGDPWLRTAVLLASSQAAAELARSLLNEPGPPASERVGLLHQLASIVGARRQTREMASLLAALPANASPAVQESIFSGLAEGLQQGGRSLGELLEHPPAELPDLARRVERWFSSASAIIRDGRSDMAQRAAAARVLAHAPLARLREVLPVLLDARQPSEVQLAAVQALAAHPQPEVAGLLLAHWSDSSPLVRRELLEALLGRANRVPELLEAIERGQVKAGELDPARQAQLRASRDPAIRTRALALLGGAAREGRQRVIERYRAALARAANAQRGKNVFAKTCTSCHRLHNEGHAVGPDLTPIRTHSKEALLIDILDPNRQVDPRYVDYVTATVSGRIVTGLVATETATSITLRRAEGVEETILRQDIDALRASGLSLMPANLEQTLTPQDVADVIAYLQAP